MSSDQNRFALIGAAGYIAPRHLRAIRDNGGELVAAFDPADSVGILDSFFPNTSYFSEFERFDRHVEKLRRKGEGVDYVAICSPNYLHDAHIRFSLRSGAHAICEKPLVLNPWNVDALEELEADGDRKIFTILQLRLHPAVIALRDRVAAEPDKIWDVDLTYITSRGGWYHVSWKGDEKKSGGIATNIGVHFYDMLSFVFGPLEENIVHLREPNRASGYLAYKRARVRWYLSIDRNDLPPHTPAGQTTYRSITVGDDEIEFSAGFTDLHTLSYEHILSGQGFGIAEVRPSIETVARIRNMEITAPGDLAHPFLARRLGA